MFLRKSNHTSPGVLKLWTCCPFLMYFGFIELDFGNQIWKFMCRYLLWEVDEYSAWILQVIDGIFRTEIIFVLNNGPVYKYFKTLCSIHHINYPKLYETRSEEDGVLYYLQICIAVSHNHFDGVQYPLECVPCTFPLKIAKMSTFIMKLCTF